jgi:hypothetical protein
MVFENYTDMDRLVLERWEDVVGLNEAYRATQERMEQAVDVAGERIARWAREQGFDGEMSAREGEFSAWRPGWYDKRKDEARVYLALGGFCPIGFRKIDENHPYLWVNTWPLDRFKVKAPERVKFAQALRTALGAEARSWQDENIDDADHPLGRYLRQYDNAARARLLMDPDSLVSFCQEHLPVVFKLADVIDPELQRLGV